MILKRFGLGNRVEEKLAFGVFIRRMAVEGLALMKILAPFVVQSRQHLVFLFKIQLLVVVGGMLLGSTSICALLGSFSSRVGFFCSSAGSASAIRGREPAAIRAIGAIAAPAPFAGADPGFGQVLETPYSAILSHHEENVPLGARNSMANSGLFWRKP
jgi:hypothetical protein